ncbi:MAG: DNA polymerase III subunit gamma/tau [Fibrobacter sp.]|nr:DNA polymerase III subunit gamma/tau [Fibrobacter sp.]
MARKWRPESFQDMVGQDHIAKTIENAIQGGRLHHAFLFTGTRGVGKTSSARILARTLNCSGGNPLSPCGKCPSCKDISGGTPMDVIEIDAASNTGVDNMRDILEKTQYTPMIGKYKIFVIDEVHMLSKGAFNALLKTLEEPPPHVIFIFATTEVNKVPQTILSRVQRFDFKRLSPEQISGRLRFICEQEGIQADRETLALFAEKADGSMRDALTYFDQVYAFTGKTMDEASVRQILGIPPNDLYFELIQAIADHQVKGCFAVIEKSYQMGLELSPLLDGFAKFLRNLLYIRVGDVDAESLNISPTLFGKLQNAVPEISNGDILRIAKMLTDLQGSLRYASHPRLLVETTLARMAWLDRITDLKKALAAMNSPTNTAANADKKKITPAPKAPPGPPSAPEMIPEPEFDPGDFKIEFDEPFTPAVEADSRYEICGKWPQIVKNLYHDSDNGFFASNLEHTTLEHGDFAVTPFPLTLRFPAKAAFGHKEITSRKDYQERLIRILEDRLQTVVTIQMEIDSETSGGKTPRSPWEKDLAGDPVLKSFAEIFELELFETKRRSRAAEPSEISCSEND